jgi:hypothetical protein
MSGVTVRASDVEVCRLWGSADCLEDLHEWDAIPDTGSFAAGSTLKRDIESLLSRGGTLQTSGLGGESEAKLATHLDPLHPGTGWPEVSRFRMLTRVNASPEVRTLRAGFGSDGVTTDFSVHIDD